MASQNIIKLRIIPLGGVDEIGKNMTVLEYGDDMVVIDCGLIFPQEDMLGIDHVIPDMTYLVKNRDKLRGFLITHGHEDHIGAIPYALKELNVPVYGTQLTLGLIENKLSEHRIHNAKLNCIKAGDRTQLGCFTIEYIKVNHSILGAVAMAITTPVGVVVVTGDFKIDYTPIDGEMTDLGRFARLGSGGVLALLMDSTNVERSGYTMSERKVGEAFDHLFGQAENGRIVVASFASNVHRVQQIVDAALKHGRKVCLCGRSMIKVGEMAMKMGMLVIPENMLVDLDQVKNYPPEEMVIITTGSQGEPMSGLVRMATNEHRQIEIQQNDTIIISAHPIPGNEKFVNRVINQLYRKGANVIYESLADVHVSGHACREELKLILKLVNPKFFIPVHGEYRHLVRHAQMAHTMGMAPGKVFIAQIGQPIEFTRRTAALGEPVPAGQVLVDGLGIGDVGNVVLRDRRILSQDGLVVAVVAINKAESRLAGEPDIVSRGFVYVKESEDLMDQARAVAKKAVLPFEGRKNIEWNNIKNAVKRDLNAFFYEKTKRNPMILPVVIEV